MCVGFGLQTYRNLSQLPNFAFSVPLAMFYIATKENSDLAPADEMVRIFHYKKKEYMLIIY